MRQDELRAPNLSCAAQLFAADAFRAGPSGFSVLPQSGLRAAAVLSCCAVSALASPSVFGESQRVPRSFQGSCASYSTCTVVNEVLLHTSRTHTRHKVLERVRCVAARLSRPRGVGPGVSRPARRHAPGPRDGRAATRVRPPPRLPPYASTKSRRPAARGPPHTGHATRRRTATSPGKRIMT